MSPIEEHFATTLKEDLAARGVREAKVEVLLAKAEDWSYRITVGDRVFEMGFNHWAQFWCAEVTPGRELDLFSNDVPQIGVSAAAREMGLRLIQTAIAHPERMVRNPPVI